MKWEKTTLRRGTKSPRICRDMFITCYSGEYTFAAQRNGRIKQKERITKQNAEQIISDFHLIGRSSPIFNRATTWRCSDSWSVVDNAIAELTT